MASVQEGLAASGGDFDFDSALAAQAGKEPAESDDARRQLEPTADDVYAAFAEDGPTTSVAAGLAEAGRQGETDRYGHSAADRARLEAEADRLMSGRGSTHGDQIEADARELAARRHADDIVNALDTLEGSDDPYERAAAWRSLSTDERGLAFDRLLVDPSEATQLDQLSEAMLNIGEQAHTTERVTAEVEANLAATRKMLNRWAEERGIAPAEARARIDEVEALVADEGGSLGELFLTDPDAGLKMLTERDAWIQEAKHVDRQHKIQQELLGEFTAGDAAYGYTVGPLTAPQLPTPALSRERQQTRMRRPLNADEFRDKMTETGGVRSGLTAGPVRGGRPISIDEATGAHEQHEAEQRAARARSMR